MDKLLPYSHQSIDETDIDAVVEVLRSDFLTQGSRVAEFEQSLIDYCGAQFAVTFSSGTAALHGACFAAGLVNGDELITSPMTFLSSANAALYLGAQPTFVDIEADTGNINNTLIQASITKNTKCIVPVHFGGHPVDLQRIKKIANENELLVIEDASHALGAKYLDTTIGDCTYSDMTVFSFHPVKSITTAEGGAVLTNNKNMYEKLLSFRQHGVTRERELFRNRSADIGGWYYEMHHLGYNYRLPDLLCALGNSQLKRLDSFIQRRIEIASKYNEAFRSTKSFDTPVEKDYARSAWHLYQIRMKERYFDQKTSIFSRLKEAGIGVQVHYIPVYFQPYYRQLGYKEQLCPNSETFYKETLSIPIYPDMSNEDIDYVIETVLEIFSYF